mmetsp:Transcript_35521/g.80145  ORF Transcript_35521/g.80145 Transcript_35521/m.80145 type:complete len:263 (-) Transcript_35521:1062-1850(-)
MGEGSQVGRHVGGEVVELQARLAAAHRVGRRVGRGHASVAPLEDGDHFASAAHLGHLPDPARDEVVVLRAQVETPIAKTRAVTLVSDVFVRAVESHGKDHEVRPESAKRERDPLRHHLSEGEPAPVLVHAPHARPLPERRHGHVHHIRCQPLGTTAAATRIEVTVKEMNGSEEEFRWLIHSADDFLRAVAMVHVEVEDSNPAHRVWVGRQRVEGAHSRRVENAKPAGGRVVNEAFDAGVVAGRPHAAEDSPLPPRNSVVHGS